MTSRPEPIRVFAPAKINLNLHVGAKRADGYHALQSLVVFARVGDELTFEPADTLSLSLNGPFAAALADDPQNLVLKAARALASQGARITLTKNLPVSSGIGGGSADAAAALRGLARLWGLGRSAGELEQLAATLGSDVPVCVASAPAWMEGRGERLTKVAPMPEIPAVLVNCGVAVPTASVFRALSVRRGTGAVCPAGFADVAALKRYLATTGNDLEAPACAIAPAIGEVLQALSAVRGAWLVRMSGSGATCFALFDEDGAAARAANELQTSHRDWWIAPTRLASGALE